MAESPPVHERRQNARHGPTPMEDLLYDSFYSAAVGGSVIAVFYLIFDLIAGQPLYTPSMVGSVWFLNIPPDQATEVRLDMVAYLTLFHFAAFGTLGLMISYIVSKMRRTPQRPIVVTVLIFIWLQAGVVIPPSLVRPGLVEALGFWRLLAGNLLTASAMAAFIWHAHRPSTRTPEAALAEGLDDRRTMTSA